MGEELLGGRYRLGEVIGSGGTGSVRAAHDTVLDRAVAVKRLRPGTDEVLRERLRLEAQLAGALHHPGIAQVFDYGEEPEADGEVTPYIVMQHVEGTSLWHLLRDRGTLPPSEVMDLIAQVATALQVAHDAGVVHRDLKPGNILVTSEGRAVLVDFGIARTLDSEPLTLTGTIVGTADYLSPEQSVGESATERSDIYALGMVAYESLTGRKPFRRESQVATALAHLREEAPPLGGDVPRGVRELVTAMVAKDPDDRPRDAAEVARLAHVLARDPKMPLTETVSLDRRALPGASGRRRRARPVRAGLLVAAVVLAVVAAAVFALGRGDGPGTPEASAESDATQASAVDERVIVPVDDLLGLRYERAARRLVRLGLVPERETVQAQSRPGTVIGVESRSRVKPGATVTLMVAVRPQAEQVDAAVEQERTTGGATTERKPQPAQAPAQAPAPADKPDNAGPPQDAPGKSGSRGQSNGKGKGRN